MPNQKLTICFARRGYSESGGAESYLKRLAQGVMNRGYQTRLFTTKDWPTTEEAGFDEVVRLKEDSPLAFANELKEIREGVKDEVLISLERVYRCDIYRAGDGVHLAWLNRRRQFELPWRKVTRNFNRKHKELLRLEESLFENRGAERIITNSRMVRNEIIDLYNYRRDMIEVVPNGIPLEQFQFDGAARQKARAHLGLDADDVAVLFAGSGWERKGLRYAIKAVAACKNPKIQLLVAGRGNQSHWSTHRTRFLGELPDLRPAYSAADIFILPTIYDPFSNACLEAMATGLPVVTTRANGFSEVMEDRIHGSIVDPPDNVDDLRIALEVWADPTRRGAARPSILKRASQFDISKNVERTLEIVIQSAKAAST